MNLSFTIIGILTVASFVSGTIITDDINRKCVGMKIHAVRIQGCAKEPCQIKKGVKVPVELDFSFKLPKRTNDIQFSVFASYWNEGFEGFGSDIAEGRGCKQLQLKACPAIAGKMHTLKSTLYAHPKLITLGGQSTGEMNTAWQLHINGKSDRSFCTFLVLFNVIK